MNILIDTNIFIYFEDFKIVDESFNKLYKVCDKFNAITIKGNLAYIDAELCKNCRKCVAVCPQELF